MAKNPFHPGVGTLPPYLAGRQPQIKRFLKQLDAFPQKRTNLRITGLRGVGKTVLLKKFESEARGLSRAIGFSPAAAIKAPHWWPRFLPTRGHGFSPLEFEIGSAKRRP